jgi:glycosyltransferase involved in cell wall biosynthesis
MRPKVSVIIPNYNYGQYIEQCILSVLVQRVNFPIEILISDDNSSDNSFEIIKRIKSFYENDKFQFKIIKNEQNLGEIKNTKNLLDNSIGQYVAYLDSDDYWISPNKLQDQVNFLDSNPDHSLCVTGHVLFNEGEFDPKNLEWWYCPKDLSLEGLLDGNYVGCSSSRLFRNYNNLIKDYFIHFPFSDWPLNFELALLGKIGYIDLPYYVYRIHQKNLSSSENHLGEEKLTNLYQQRMEILKSIYDQHIMQKTSANPS